jgi:valyl-tRNA synthetase
VCPSLFQGLIDPAKETDKLEKKRSLLSTSLDKLKKSMELDGYETKVPVEVRSANAEKVQQIETELHRLNDAIQALKNL